MSMSPVTATLVTTSVAKANRLSMMARNSANILKTGFSHAMQEPGNFKNNSLIVGMLLLVIARVTMANGAAIKAKGTDQAEYKQREAVKTTTREAVGYTFSYTLFRLVQRATEKILRMTFGLKKSPILLLDSLKYLGKAIKQGAKGQALSEADKLAFKNRVMSDWKVVDPNKLLHRYDKLGVDSLFVKDGRLFSHMYNETKTVYDAARQSFEDKLLSEEGMTKANEAMKQAGKIYHEFAESRIKKVYTWAPIIIAAIPAIWLSGFWLERFTRDRSEEVLDKITKFKANLSGEPTPTAISQRVEQFSYRTRNEVEFNAFISNANQKRNQRGW